MKLLLAAMVLAPFIGGVVVLRWAAEMMVAELNEIEEEL